jgi:thiol-disulfide isomerase/thioredoxin
MTIATLLIALCVPAADRADAPVILDFTAPWCGPCQQMKPAIAQLAKSGYPIKAVDYDTSPLVRRYKIKAVPTFVVVDGEGRELDRTSGFQPASEIATMYRKAKAKLGPADEEREDEDVGREPREANDDEDASPATTRKPPRPWETVVRIRIDNRNLVEFGSGTIIYSTPDEAIILTCAHIFRVSGARQQYAPSKFPSRITIELSDGQLQRQSTPDSKGGSRAGVRMLSNEPFQGEAIDYDFAHDVGLIRIRPGRRLPSSPVVPADWQPRAGLEMTTVGCSEGHDATAWTTRITKPLMTGVQGYPNYEAMECLYAPKQGRSGGGLYTTDGMLAGVCDFAEPTDNHGLYATPRAIHSFLDRNKLTVCYAPDAGRSRGKPGTMLAQGRAGTGARRSNVADTLRAQGPDEPRQKPLSIPSPDDLHIAPIAANDDDAPARSSSDNRRKPAWSNVRVASNPSSASGDESEGQRRMMPAEMTMTPRGERDPFAEIGDIPSEKPKTLPVAPQSKPRSSSPWKSASTANRPAA